MILFDVATNSNHIRAYGTGILVPVLKRGDTLILGSLHSPNVDGVRQAIGATGARLLDLSAYSPDVNPIEQAFARPKTFLHTAVERKVSDL